MSELFFFFVVVVIFYASGPLPSEKLKTEKKKTLSPSAIMAKNEEWKAGEWRRLERQECKRSILAGAHGLVFFFCFFFLLRSGRPPGRSSGWDHRWHAAPAAAAPNPTSWHHAGVFALHAVQKKGREKKARGCACRLEKKKRKERKERVIHRAH